VLKPVFSVHGLAIDHRQACVRNCIPDLGFDSWSGEWFRFVAAISEHRTSRCLDTRELSEV
jgi:hypothetical protein